VNNKQLLKFTLMGILVLFAYKVEADPNSGGTESISSGENDIVVTNPNGTIQSGNSSPVNNGTTTIENNNAPLVLRTSETIGNNNFSPVIRPGGGGIISLSSSSSQQTLLHESSSIIPPQDPNTDDFCGVNKAPIERRAFLDFSPNYFISPHPDKNYVGAITPDGNVLVDLNNVNVDTNGAEKYRLPYKYDPVFTPDGVNITIPGMTTYSFSEVDKGISNGEKDFSNMKPTSRPGVADGVYQSVGMYNKKIGDKEVKVYRYIDDTNEASVSDYRVMDDGTTKIIGGHDRLCPKVRGRDLPMLSKDGKYASFLSQGTTKIFKISRSGKCKQVVDLGFATGKVSFDFTGNKLAFHVDAVRTNRNFFSDIGKHTKDVFVVNIEKEGEGSDDEKWKKTAITRITSNLKSGHGSYYPRFRRDGTIVMISAFSSPSGRKDYTLDVVDPDKSVWTNYVPTDDKGVSKNQCGETYTFGSLQALGWLWE
jgi:hypothetical protein